METKQIEFMELEPLIKRINSLKPTLDSYFRGELFHYTSIFALEQIVTNHTLRLTRSDFLNDRDELIHTIDLLKRVYKETNWNKITDRFFGKLITEVNKHINNSFILSLSKNEDSLALWGIYSKFTGYNFKLSLEDLYHDHIFNEELYVKKNDPLKNNKRFITRKDNKFLFYSGDVLYDERQQFNMLQEALFVLDDLLNEKPEIIDNYYKELIWSIVYNILLFKNTSFKHEEEYRVILKIKGSTSNFTHYRIHEGAFIPYVEIGSNYNLPIKSVTLGPKLNIDIAEKGLKLFLNSKDYKVGQKENNLKVCKSKIPIRY